MATLAAVGNYPEQLNISHRLTIERKYLPVPSPYELKDKAAEDALYALYRAYSALADASEPDVTARYICALLPIIEHGFKTEYEDRLMTMFLFPAVLAPLSLLHSRITDAPLREPINAFFHKYTNADCSLDAAVELYYDIRELDAEADFFLGVIDYHFPPWMTFKNN